MEKSVKQGNKNAWKFQDGTVEDNELEFTQLKRLYTDVILQQVTEMLRPIDAAVTSQLLTTPRVPKTTKTLPLSSGGTVWGPDIEPSEITVGNAIPESLSQLSGEESEAESMTSVEDRAVAPTKTKYIQFVPMALNIASKVLPTLARVGSRVFNVAKNVLPDAIDAVGSLAQGKALGEDEDEEDVVYVQGPPQSPYPPFLPNMMPPNLFQPQILADGNPYSGYMQNLYDQYIEPSFAPFGPQMPPQVPYQPQIPFGQGVPSMYPEPLNPPDYGYAAGYPQGPYQPQNPALYGDPAGYPQGPYQPQNPPRYGDPAGYPQGPYQPQNPPRYGDPAGYPQGHYQPQNPPRYGDPAGYPQGPYQPQNTPRYRDPNGYPQGPYQPQNPPRYGDPAGYLQGSYRPQSLSGPPSGYPQRPQQPQLAPPGQWQSVSPSYPQSYYQQHYPPQSFPSRTRSANRGLSPSATRSQRRGLYSHSLSPSSTPERSPIPTKQEGNSPSEFGITEVKMPPEKMVSNQQNKLPTFDNLEGEVVKSLKNIDNQIHVILNKLTS